MPRGQNQGLAATCWVIKQRIPSLKCVKVCHGSACFRHFLFTVSIRLKITRNTLTGLKPSIPMRLSRSKSRHPRTLIWWPWEATMLERILFRLMVDMAARERHPRLPRRILPCQSSWLFRRCIASSSRRVSAMKWS